MNMLLMLLQHCKKGHVFQLLTLMKCCLGHDAEWQPTKDFADPNGTMNNNFYNYIKRKEI